jgi:hypothetical protein
VKLRRHGTRPEVTEATRCMVQALDVVAAPPLYMDRGARVLVRVDLQVRLSPTPKDGLEGRDGPAATLDTGEVGG